MLSFHQLPFLPNFAKQARSRPSQSHHVSITAPSADHAKSTLGHSSSSSAVIHAASTKSFVPSANSTVNTGNNLAGSSVDLTLSQLVGKFFLSIFSFTAIFIFCLVRPLPIPPNLSWIYNPTPLQRGMRTSGTRLCLTSQRILHHTKLLPNLTYPTKYLAVPNLLLLHLTSPRLPSLHLTSPRLPSLVRLKMSMQHILPLHLAAVLHAWILLKDAE